jgi:hypothetical protein
MELTIYFPSDLALLFQDERNRGIDAVPGLVDQIERLGTKVRRVDVGQLSAELRMREYAKAIVPAVHKKYEVKRIFGTNRRSACWFGQQVPALMVKQAEDDIGDTYPHRGPRNTVVTIQQVLSVAIEALKRSELAVQQQEREQGGA